MSLAPAVALGGIKEQCRGERAALSDWRRLVRVGIRIGLETDAQFVVWVASHFAGNAKPKAGAFGASRARNDQDEKDARAYPCADSQPVTPP
jgi:hypothetical protein